MAHEVAVDRVVVGLIPDIGELAVFGFLLHDLKRLVAAESVKEEDPVRAQGVIDGAEVTLHLLPLLQQPVTEVHRQHDVHALGLRVKHILVEHGQALLLRGAEPRQVPPPPPFEHRRVQIDGDGAVGLAAADPLAGGVHRAAEVLAQGARLALAHLLEHVVDEIDLGVHALHRFFVEFMDVGGFRQGFSFIACHVLSPLFFSAFLFQRAALFHLAPTNCPAK